jgi:hypothetical protein
MTGHASDEELTKVALRASYDLGRHDGGREAAERNARYIAKAHLQMAESALTLTVDLTDDALARRALNIANRLLATTPLSHFDEATLRTAQKARGNRTSGVDRELVADALACVVADIAQLELRAR